jgi:KDO2-lipid IV(A) lauroyltransferase
MFYYYLLKYGQYVVRFVPLRVGYAVCWLIGWAVYWGQGRVRRAVLGNLRHVVPHESEAQRGRLGRRIIINQQKNYYDLMRLPHLSAADISAMVDVQGIEHFEAALAQGKGAILASPHLGNYNLATQIAVARRIKAHIIAERLKPPKAHNLINGLRQRLGLHLIPLDDPNLARAIFKLLRAGEVLGLAMDREMTGNGVAVDLCGRPAMLPAGPVTLALRLGVPLVPVRVERLSNLRTVVWVYPPLALERTGDMKRDIVTGTQRLAGLLEEMVRQTPDQWVVLQPVWAEDGGPPLPTPAPAPAPAPTPALVPEPAPEPESDPIRQSA